MALKVAIIGFSPSRDQAPWDDSEWEKWGLAWDPDALSLDRVFEMHDSRQLTDPQYLERLQEFPRLYMQEGAHAYPFEEVAKSCGAYWCSSIAYAMALAIHEQAQEIAVYGVDMKSSTEYGYQKANMEYLIGFARGKGITVHIPEQSPLTKFESDPDFEYIGRYGWLG